MLQRVALFGLAVGCAPRPSTVALGGDEWLLPERHLDRRAASEKPDAPQASAPKLVAARAAGSASAAPRAAVAAPPGAAPAKNGEVAFRWAPLANGDVVTLEKDYTIRASLSAGGGEATQSLRLTAHSHLDVSVASADADGPRELDVAYVGSTVMMQFGDMPARNENEPDKRFHVSFSGGEPKVSSSDGDSNSEREKTVVFDLATVTGFAPLVKSHLPASIAPGWSSPLPASDIARAFGVAGAVTFDRYELRFKGLDRAAANTAAFDCALRASGSIEGMQISADLHGSCSARPDDTRPLDVALSGNVSGEMAGALAGAKLEGSLELKFKHGYKRR